MRVLLVFVTVVLAAGCVAVSEREGSPTGTSFWEERVGRIQVGMRREEVEQILNVSRMGHSPVTTITGGAQASVYAVAPGFSVTVFYDFTGALRGGAGYASPDNRVIAAAKLSPRSEHESVSSCCSRATMQSQDLVTRAARLAELAHNGQFRRDGVTPYVRHPEAVAARVATA